MRHLAWMFLLGLFGLGCSSTGVGNPGFADQSLVVSSDPELEPNATDSGEQLDPSSLRHAVLVFGKLRFIACDPQELPVVVQGPIVVDLAQNRMEPASITISEVPASGCCGIDAVLAPATAPASMSGRSLFFSGVRGDGTAFLLFANMAGTLHLRPLPGVTWVVDGEHSWLWAMRPRRWLTPSELDAAEAEPTDGVERIIAINVDRHPVLYNAIRARLAGRSTLHVDLNDNHQLDPDERLNQALIGRGLDSLD
ncbi:MAG TPA: hypothetical protein VKP30_18120 [Polyangiaceae bacterium]|nr:hypothetical protein [Polyangiaceae bacterium]